jgi:hypothetical protein
MFLNLSADLVYDSTFNQNLLTENLAIYMDLAQKDLARYRQENSRKKNKKANDYDYYESYNYDSDYYFNDYLSLFQAIPNTPKINELVRQIADLMPGGDVTKLDAVRFLLDKKQKIDSKWLKELLQDEKMYFNCLQMLRNAEQLSLAPKKYLKPSKIAQATLKNQIENYFGYQEFEISHLDERIIEYNGEKVRVFTYKFSLPKYDDYALEADSAKPEKIDYYVGISGPFPVKSKKVGFSEELTGFTYEAIELGKLEEAIDKLIEEKTKVWEEDSEDVKEED